MNGTLKNHGPFATASARDRVIYRPNGLRYTDGWFWRFNDDDSWTQDPDTEWNGPHPTRDAARRAYNRL